MTPDVHPRTQVALKAVTRCSIALAVAVSLLVLAGWVWNVEALKGLLRPNPIAMNPLTAVGFLFCAASLGFQINDGGKRNWIGRILAVAVVVAAILVLGSYFSLWSVQIDEWMFRSSLVIRQAHNRMAPNTAGDFLLTGLGLLLLDLRTRWGFWPSQAATLLAAGTGLLALSGYAFLALSFYRIAMAVPMALNTALCFSSLTLGTLCARADADDRK